LPHVKGGLSRCIRCSTTVALLGRLEEYVTTIIALHIQRIGYEKNNVKKNNALAQMGRVRPEWDLRGLGAISAKEQFFGMILKWFFYPISGSIF
jgi:hypothetical protein